MKPVSRDWGARGGHTRAKRLSPMQRSLIARQGAHARWQRPANAHKAMPSVRLHSPDWANPVYVEEVLAEGTLHDWRQLYQHIREFPFGATATALECVLRATALYGVTPLWRGVLTDAQGTTA